MTRAKQILEMYYDLEEGVGKVAGAAALGASGYGLYKKHVAGKGDGDTKKAAGNLARKAASHITSGMHSEKAQQLKDVMTHLKGN